MPQPSDDTTGRLTLSHPPTSALYRHDGPLCPTMERVSSSRFERLSARTPDSLLTAHIERVRFGSRINCSDCVTVRGKIWLKGTSLVADAWIMLTSESPITPEIQTGRPRPYVNSGGAKADVLRKPVVHRHHAGAVLRGYRIPLSLHRKAERIKLSDSVERGATIYWDELLQDAIDRLSDQPADVAPMLPAQTHRAEAAGATRVLQAAIRTDQDMKLRMLRLDLEEYTGKAVKLEDLWVALVTELVN